MDYETSLRKIERQVDYSFDNKFIIQADISNFYPSVYTHSIPWALVGFDYAKANRNPSDWFNQIDKYQRLLKRNETNGVAIGPATSNIVSEIILSTIDKVLDTEGYKFVRFIDDYTAYTRTYEDAETFLRRLSEELSKFKLNVNARKQVSILYLKHQQVIGLLI
jgi:hypothetical protein